MAAPAVQVESVVGLKSTLEVADEREDAIVFGNGAVGD
jgi:hypothetical protein